MTEMTRVQQMNKTQLMGELRTILLAVDGSPYSEGAIKEALMLAGSCDIKLTLLYVSVLSDGFESGGMTFVEKLDNDTTGYLDKIREDGMESNVEVDIIVRRTNEAYKGIIEEAAERESDVIIMGRRGMTGLKKLLMGSVTAKVIAYAPCKVLVVPKEAAIKGEHILFATDGSKYSEAASMEAISMARRCPNIKTFTILSVAHNRDKLPEAQAFAEHVANRAEKSEQVKVEALAVVGSPYEVIIETAAKRGSDIIIMGTHGRTGIEKLLMGSVAERVVALAPCSVLVVKE
jgi:hypothetical protein